MHKIDLNSDMGESFGGFEIGYDEELVNVITSASLACGFHGGDPLVLFRTANLCKERNVAIGAHPSFPDLMGFGRRKMELNSDELFAYVLYQVSAVKGVAEATGVGLQHVKPHGALYNMAWTRSDYAEAIARAVRALTPSLILLAPYGSELANAALRQDLIVAFEGFPERGYTDEGVLAPRNTAGAVLTRPEEVAKRAVMMAEDGRVKSISGKTIELQVDTLCIHSDTPGAGDIAKAVRKELEAAGFEIQPLGSFLRSRRR